MMAPDPSPVATAIPPVRLLGWAFDYKYAVAIVYVSAIFLDILDTAIVNVALPTLAADFHTSAVEWVVLGYTLSLAVWIPASGWLADRYGTRRILLTAITMFLAGSALCGSADSIGQLIAYRVVQGVGGGMIAPVGIAMMFRAFAPSERARASMFAMVPTLLAPALGPIIGGYLIGSWGWRWIFYINLPIGSLVLAFGWLVLREHREPTAGRFDVAGFFLSAGALTLVLFALSEGSRAGWSSASVVVTGLVGLVLAVATVIVETRVEAPMLALRLFKDAMFRKTNLVNLFSMAGFFGMIFLVPLYLQTLRGFTPLQAGQATFTQAIGVVISSQISGRLYGTVGPRRLIFGGLLSASFVNAAYVLLDTDSGPWTVRWLFLVRGFCMGFAFVPMQAATYSTIKPADNGRASSIFSTMRQVSVSVSVAVLATVLAGFTPVGRPATDVVRALRGFRASYLVAAGMTAVAALLALRINDDDAAASMNVRSSAGA